MTLPLGDMALQAAWADYQEAIEARSAAISRWCAAMEAETRAWEGGGFQELHAALAAEAAARTLMNIAVNTTYGLFQVWLGLSAAAEQQKAGAA